MTAVVASLLAAVEIGWPLERGTLALFPLFHELQPAPRYATGTTGASRLRIGEKADGAVVPELEITNDSDEPVLLVDGESLVGARQNRIVTASVVVPPHTTATVSVTCVEQGRWGAPQPVARSARHAPSAVRARNRASVVEGGCVQPDQSGVWEEVDRYAERFGVDSPTRAMEDVHARAASGVGNLVAGSAPLAGQCGVAVAVDDRVVAVDLFDSPDALRAHWASLVAGYALDAAPRPSSHPRRRDVRRVLAAIAAGEASAADGRIHLAGCGVQATALVHDGVVVHLAANVRSEGDGPPTRRRWF